jgi:hypothetical protein
VLDPLCGTLDDLRPHLEPIDHGRSQARGSRALDVARVGRLDFPSFGPEPLRDAEKRAILRFSVELADLPSRYLGPFGKLSDVGHLGT